jgi:hypothetical protein
VNQATDGRTGRPAGTSKPPSANHAVNFFVSFAEHVTAPAEGPRVGDQVLGWRLMMSSSRPAFNELVAPGIRVVNVSAKDGRASSACVPA